MTPTVLDRRGYEQLRALMSWSLTNLSRSQIDKAGRCLRKSEGDLELARATVREWRAAHSFPLALARGRLQFMLQSMLGLDAIIAQRPKRMESIEAKLKRGTTRLSDMQDMAGCRVVFSHVAHVGNAKRVVPLLFGPATHEDDYIQHPKPDGYRSFHSIHNCESMSEEIGGMVIELQLRTKLQHAWATAIETVDAFSNQKLKAGIKDDRWSPFFCLVSSAFAIKEGMPTAPGTPTTLDEIRAELKKSDVPIHLLGLYTGIQKFLTMERSPIKNDGPYFVLVTDFKSFATSIHGYGVENLEAANAALAKVEKEITAGAKKNAVLVCADDLPAVRNAYPNYFADLKYFINEVESLTN